MSFVATVELVELVDKVQRRINPDLKILGYFGTMFDNRTNESKQSIQEMKQKYGEKVFNTTIPVTTSIAQAARKGMSVIDHARNSKGSKAYQALVNEIIKSISAI
jgi:chromosome partitioning protein